MGLKENVIIGKLIPAGTGIPEVEASLAARDPRNVQPTVEELANE